MPPADGKGGCPRNDPRPQAALPCPAARTTLPGRRGGGAGPPTHFPACSAAAFWPAHWLFAVVAPPRRAPRVSVGSERRCWRDGGGRRGRRRQGLLGPGGGMGYWAGALAKGAMCEYRGLGRQGAAGALWRQRGVVGGCSGFVGGGGLGSGVRRSRPGAAAAGILPWGGHRFFFRL